MYRAIYALGQAAGVASLLYGLFVLFGVGWAAVAAGIIVLTGSTLLEVASYGSTPDGKSGG